MMARIGRLFLGSPTRAAASVSIALVSVIAILIAVPTLGVVFGIIGSVAAALGFLIRIYPNDAKRIAGNLYGAAAWLSSSAERESTRKTIEGALGPGIKHLASIAPESAPGDIQIEFVRSGEQVEELPNGTLLLGIAHHKNKTRNLVAAAWLYARFGLIPLARRHLDQDVSRGIDFVATKLILRRADVRAVNEFITEIWVPALANEERLRALTDKLEALEADRLFGPILLQELASLGLVLANKGPQGSVAAETAQFVEQLFDLAHREPGQFGPLGFEGEHIRCRWILVGKAETLATLGTTPYREAIRHAIDDTCPRIYIVARGPFVAAAREVGDAFKQDSGVLWVREFYDRLEAPGGQGAPRLVTQIEVDVRQYVGIGQRPIFAAGPNYESVMQARKDRSRLRRS